jgi:hypothetical protein
LWQDFVLAGVFHYEMLAMDPTFMKKTTVLLLLSLWLPLISSFGQEFPPPQPELAGGRAGGLVGGGGRGGMVIRNGGATQTSPETGQATGLPNPPPVLPTFDLDFPGGTPADLVAAIQKASGKPLNAIIPDRYAQEHLPAMKMKEVNTAKLFEALLSSSREKVPIITDIYRDGRSPSFTYETRSYGFRTQGTPREDSIWYFQVDETKTPPFLEESEPGPTNICRFYQLERYLQMDYKVEDITTAITTGWKMLGVKPVPTLSFHKETQLLIAVGPSDSLKLVDQLLSQLTTARGPGATPAAPARRASPPLRPNAGTDQP